MEASRRCLLLAVLKCLQAPGWYQRLCRQYTGRGAIGTRRPMRRNSYYTSASINQAGPGREKSERRQQVSSRRAVDRRQGAGLCLGRAPGVVVVLLRQLLLHLVTPRPSAIVQGHRRAAVIVSLLPGPLPLLVAVQILRRGTLRVLRAILAQQATYTERVAPRRLVLQRSGAGLIRRRRVGGLGVLLRQATVVVRVVTRAAAPGVRVVHVDLLRRVHVAVAVNRHDPFGLLSPIDPDPPEVIRGCPTRSFTEGNLGDSFCASVTPRRSLLILSFSTGTALDSGRRR